MKPVICRPLQFCEAPITKRNETVTFIRKCSQPVFLLVICVFCHTYLGVIYFCDLYWFQVKFINFTWNFIMFWRNFLILGKMGYYVFSSNVVALLFNYIENLNFKFFLAWHVFILATLLHFWLNFWIMWRNLVVLGKICSLFYVIVHYIRHFYIFFVFAK